ncbi:MAG: Lactate 2-monooxygenase [Gemmataceae bacterium]|nr:Lactate 2-monooxygenase [Gemmataceae bacterium]
MLRRLSRLLGTAGPDPPGDVDYDPVYGLPRHAVEEWLARNPQLREEYEAALHARDASPRIGDDWPAGRRPPAMTPGSGSTVAPRPAPYDTGVVGWSPPRPGAVEELERQARGEMKPEAYDYLTGGAGAGDTLRANREAFRRWRIVPRVLRDVAHRDLGVDLFGRRFPWPVLLAPVGMQSVFHGKGELAVARAARAVGVPLILSSVSSRTLEEVAGEMGDAPHWFQLYWPANLELAASLLRRAEGAGYTAVVVTVDAPLLSGCERDELDPHLPVVCREGLANYYSDPVFRAAVGGAPERHPERAARYFAATYMNPAFTWGDIPFLRRQTGLPILLKGVLDPEDAARAVASGVDGIIVSNHGGRQLDGAIGALDALPAVVGAVAGRAAVLFDSGIRYGADAFKALALGAQAVLLGRPYCYGLAVGGERGVREVLEGFLADLDLTLALAGCVSVNQLGRANLVETPASGPGG